MEILLMVVVFVGLMYVLMVLPQKKKMDQQRKMLNALEPGARVMLTSGLFGTVRASAENQMVVELAPGVEVTVIKQAVARVVNSDEEEFEYTDDEAEISTADEFVADGEQGWPVDPSTTPSTTEPAADAPIDFEPPASPQLDQDVASQTDTDDQSR